MAKELSSGNFAAEVLDHKGPALVDFWAPWCGPCRLMGPIVDNLAKKFDGTVKIAKVNVDDCQDLAQKYNVMSIPTLVFFKNGQVVNTHLGSTTEADLEKKIREHLL